MTTATHTLTDSELRETAEALKKDGDTYELPDGRILRLTFAPDFDYTINDYDSDGKVSEFHDYRTRGEYPAERPAGFDGRAVKIELRDGWVWWQPCKGAIYPDRHSFNQDKYRIHDLLEYGFNVVMVELCAGKDAYGRPIVRNVASLGGVDATDAGMIADLITEALTL